MTKPSKLNLKSRSTHELGDPTGYISIEDTGASSYIVKIYEYGNEHTKGSDDRTASYELSHDDMQNLLRCIGFVRS